MTARRNSPKEVGSKRSAVIGCQSYTILTITVFAKQKAAAGQPNGITCLVFLQRNPPILQFKFHTGTSVTALSESIWARKQKVSQHISQEECRRRVLLRHFHISKPIILFCEMLTFPLSPSMDKCLHRRVIAKHIKAKHAINCTPILPINTHLRHFDPLVLFISMIQLILFPSGCKNGHK